MYLSVVDREGNIASWIQSIYGGFGSGIVPEGLGFVLQNRGAGSRWTRRIRMCWPGASGRITRLFPGSWRREASHVGFGIMGGANQPMAHAQFVSNFVEYGMNLQKAMESPRFFKNGPSGCEVSIESRVPEATLRNLAEMGHIITLRAEYSQEMGRGQAILHNSTTGTNYAASDPRADGAAAPEPLRF